MTFDDAYPPPWRTDFNRDIANSLTGQTVHCPHYRWRKSFNFDDNGEVLVLCGINRSQLRIYSVLTPLRKVAGPLSSDDINRLGLREIYSAPLNE